MVSPSQAKILLVDDEVVVTLQLEQSLGNLGYAIVGTANSGTQAIEMAGTTLPDLILMDIVMPGEVDGIEAARQIRKAHGIPCIFLTAHSSDAFVERSKQAHPLGWLAKPFDEREVRASIELALHKKKIEHLLRQSEARYRAVIEDQSELICRFAPSGELTFVNTAYCRFFGRDSAQLLGQPFRSPLLEKDQEHLDFDLSGFSKDSPTAAYEHRVVLPDDSERWIQWTNRAIFDNDGYLVEFQSVGRDISKRKKAEEQVEERRALYRRIFDSVSDGIVIMTHSGHLVEANHQAAEMHGYGEEQLLQLRGDQLLHQSYRHLTQEMIQYVEQGHQFHGQLVHLRSDGNTFDADVTASSIEYSGRPHLLVTFRDLSSQTEAQKERLRLQRQLEHAQKMEALGTLAGGIAHDFNNLLMAIGGNASCILAELDPEDPLQEPVVEISEQVSRGSELTNQLLGYARQGQYHVAPLDLCKLVWETAQTFGRTNRDITLTCQRPRRSFFVAADQNQMLQVLLNIFVNSVDAMDQGGKLTVVQERVKHHQVPAKFGEMDCKDFLKIAISDTGRGMDAETQKRIFEPFFTTKKVGEGTGLGLASVYGIMTRHNGFIDLTSQTGKGTTVCLYLPESTQKPEPVSKTAEPTKGAQRQVLVVDDEQAVLKVTSRMLKRIDCRVLTANSGQECLQLLRSKGDSIDLVILDMRMPGMGGEETFQKIREFSKVQVLLASGYSAETEASHILASGDRCGFIQKPFSLEDLKQRLQTIFKP